MNILLALIVIAGLVSTENIFYRFKEAIAEISTSEETDEKITRCSFYNERNVNKSHGHPNLTEIEEEEEFSQLIDECLKTADFDFGIIFPGTKWCGLGNNANNDSDLGSEEETDKCCRIHDHCNDSITAFKSKYGLRNFGVTTKSHCRCDCEFYDCLKEANTTSSNRVGKLFFNILRMKCFREDYPESCAENEIVKDGNVENIIGHQNFEEIQRENFGKLLEDFSQYQGFGFEFKVIYPGIKTVVIPSNKRSFSLISILKRREFQPFNAVFFSSSFENETKWCGIGNIAKDENDLGEQVETDKCCRTHDHCNDSIEAFQSRHGLKNDGLTTKSHCRCDCEFYDCLKKVNNPASTDVGNWFFNIWEMECFREVYPETCAEGDIGKLEEACFECDFERTNDTKWKFFSSLKY